MELKIAAGTATAFLALAVTPILFIPSAGSGDRANGCGQDVSVVLATIRQLESGGDYTARARGSSASGGYQYIDATWQHWAQRAGINITTYPSAWMAPPEQQDAVATANVRAILTEHHGDLGAIPLIWYYPRALTNPDLLHDIPHPQAGNTRTPAQYQARWLALYRQRATTGTPSDPGSRPSADCGGVTSADGNWALPAPADILANAGITRPHHDYPAVDLMIPEGTPIFAIAAGTVTRTTHFSANWWQAR